MYVYMYREHLRAGMSLEECEQTIRKIHVCMYVCTYVYMYVCMCVYMYERVHVYVCLCA